MKAGSDFLRGTIAEALKDESTGAISAVDQQLTKFHGIYMQDDRDIRDERKASGLEPAYSFMVRVRLPGCVSTPEQWLKMDELADAYGNHTMKITTRGTFQLHGVIKKLLKPAIRGMNSALLDTVAACGDVDRNVVAAALPNNKKIHDEVVKYSYLISEHLLPRPLLTMRFGLKVPMIWIRPVTLRLSRADLMVLRRRRFLFLRALLLTRNPFMVLSISPQVQDQYCCSSLQ